MSATGSAWGRPRSDAPTRAPASSSASNGTPKAKAPAKAPINIAALAARNLGGFVPNKIFVGGVPVTCTDEQFRNYFEQYGAISKVELHALRGFGYITYESVDAVDSCLEKYEEHYFGKKWVEVKRSIPRELIDSYEREQRRLQAEHSGVPEAPSSSAPSTSTPGLPGLPPPPAGPAKNNQDGAPSPGATTPSGRVVQRGPTGGPPRGPPEPAGTTSKVAQLKEMGFSEAVAKKALAESVWDVNAAIDRLLASGALPGMDDSPPDAGPAADENPPLSAAVTAKAAAPGPPKAASRVEPAPNGTPMPVLPAAGRPWGPPPPGGSGSTPEPRGCWGAGAPSIRSNSGPTQAKAATPQPATADSTVAPTRSAEGPTANPSGYGGPVTSPSLTSSGAPEPPATGPPPPPASIVAAQAAAAQAAPSEALGLPLGVLGVSAVTEEETPAAAAPVPAVPVEATATMAATDVVAAEPAAAVDLVASVVAVAEEENAPAEELTQVVGGGATTVVASNGAGPEGAMPGSAPPTSGAGAAPPRKQIERAQRAWGAEDPSQMSVEQGEFVDVWVDTSTEHGWIHAEKHLESTMGPQVGWLPLCVLEQIDSTKRWMRARQHWQALDESQASVEEGGCVIVWIGSRTQEGWTYVEAEKEGGEKRPGWLPVFCLEWQE